MTDRTSGFSRILLMALVCICILEKTAYADITFLITDDGGGGVNIAGVGRGGIEEAGNPGEDNFDQDNFGTKYLSNVAVNNIVLPSTGTLENTTTAQSRAVTSVRVDSDVTADDFRISVSSNIGFAAEVADDPITPADESMDADDFRFNSFTNSSAVTFADFIPGTHILNPSGGSDEEIFGEVSVIVEDTPGIIITASDDGSGGVRVVGEGSGFTTDDNNTGDNDFDLNNFFSNFLADPSIDNVAADTIVSGSLSNGVDTVNITGFTVDADTNDGFDNDIDFDTDSVIAFTEGQEFIISFEAVFNASTLTIDDFVAGSHIEGGGNSSEEIFGQTRFVVEVAAVPEPSSMAFLGSLGLIILRRSRKS